MGLAEMGIENIKRWHWCVIGLIAGAIYASVKLWTGVEEPEGTEYPRPVEFEAQLFEHRDPRTRSQVHRVDNFVIHAAEKIPVRGSWVSTEYVTYDAWLIDRPKPLRPGEKPAPPPVLKPGEKPQVFATKYKQFLVLQSGDRSAVAGDVSKMPVREYIQKMRDKVAELKAADAKRYATLSTIDFKYDWLGSP